MWRNGRLLRGRSTFLLRHRGPLFKQSRRSAKALDSLWAIAIRPFRCHASSLSIERRYAYGFVRSDSRLSTLYMVPETTSESAAPARRAVGTANPAATSEAPADTNVMPKRPLPSQRMRRPVSACLRLAMAGSTSFLCRSTMRCRRVSVGMPASSNFKGLRDSRTLLVSSCGDASRLPEVSFSHYARK